MMKVADYIRRLASADENERINVVESINIQNYAMNMLSETDMWILRTAAENVEYLNHKLKEAETSTLGKDLEAPEEELLTLDDNASTETEETELSLDDTELSLDDTELSLDDTTETDTSELSLDDTTETEETELSLDDTSSNPKVEKDEKKIETSIEGVGILPLLAEIQEKIANGKPSEIELAALKAMKKLF